MEKEYNIKDSTGEKTLLLSKSDNNLDWDDDDDDWWLMMIDDDWWLMTMIDDDDWWWLMIDDDDDGDDDDDDGSYSCNLSAAMLLFKLATTKVGFVCLSLCSI